MNTDKMRQIPNHPGYFISKAGIVVSTKYGKTRVLKTRIAKESGYVKVKLGDRSALVHRLLAQTFIPNPGGKSDVNHIDGVKTNNAIGNLEWVTRAENLRHAMDTGLHAAPPTPIVGTHVRTGQTVCFSSQADAARRGFQQANINACLKGRRRVAHSRTWAYA